MKIGVIADCMKRANLEEALADAAKLGAQGVQIYATKGEFSPEMGDSARRGFRNLLKSLGLQVSALCGDMGGFGFERADDNPERIERTKEIVNLAAEFGAEAVTTHIGVIPLDPEDPIYRNLLSALTEIGGYARELGVTAAIETGPEPALTLRGFLDRTEGGVGVNLDPANFVMVTGQDPVEAVRILGDSIVHTHAKDGVMLKKSDPAVVYGILARGGIECRELGNYFRETPVGSGAVDFPAYLAALRESGYDGYLTVEREAGSKPFDDIAGAVHYLKRELEKIK